MSQKHESKSSEPRTIAKRHRLPHRRLGIRMVVGTGKDKVHMSTGEYEDGTIGEIFLDHQREGTFGRAMINAFAISVSIGLQHGIPLKAYAHTLRGLKMEPDLMRGIFDELDEFYDDNGRCRV